MSDQPPSSPPSSGSLFCAECGAAMPADARFCGSCGAAPPGAPAAPAADAPTEPGGASTWQGVAPVVERPGDPTAAVPAAATTSAAAVAGGPPPGAGGPPAGGPPAGGPPAGGPPDTAAKGRGKGPLIVVALVLLAALIGGFLLLGGGDDDDDDDVVAAEEEDDDEETTTTEAEEEETTTTTEAEEEETTTTAGEEVPEQLFDRLVDDTGTLVVEVPVEWVDRSTAPTNGQPLILASTDLATARQNFTAPEVEYILLANTPVDFNAAIDAAIGLGNLANACVPAERQDYDDGVFVGRHQRFDNCGGIGSTVFQIAAANSAGVSVGVLIQLTELDSEEIANHIVETFNTTAG